MGGRGASAQRKTEQVVTFVMLTSQADGACCQNHEQEKFEQLGKRVHCSDHGCLQSTRRHQSNQHMIFRRKEAERLKIDLRRENLSRSNVLTSCTASETSNYAFKQTKKKGTKGLEWKGEGGAEAGKTKTGVCEIGI